MRKDNRGISRIVEFVIMFTVFIVIVTAFYSLANIWLRPPIVDYNQEEAMRISEVLINNPGCMDSNNSKTNWEDYPAYYKDAPNIDTNMTSLGFAKNKNSYGVLSMSKILGMGKITYSKARKMLALSPGQNFNISFQITGNETKTFWGADYSNAKNVGIYKRIVAVYNPINNSYTSAKLTICIFDGGFYDESIKINEIMYDPLTAEPQNEWVELYNPTSMAIDMYWWSIFDGLNWNWLDGAIKDEYPYNVVGYRGTIIPSNGYAIVYNNLESVYKNFSAHNPDAVWLTRKNSTGGVTGISFSLDNTGDTVLLRNRYYDEVDRVEYLSGWSEGGANGNNESLEKCNPFRENVDGNWNDSCTGYPPEGKGGTLGRRNSISDFSNPNLGNLISVGPDRRNISCVAGTNASFNITVMNNGNINDTITISNISELGWNVSIVWLSGGTVNWTNPDGTIGVNLSAINRTTTVSHIYAKLRVNITIPTTAKAGEQNIAIVIAKSSEYSMVFDIASILMKVS